MSQADVEQLVALVYDWRAHLHDPTSYWVTGEDAAELVGVSSSRMRLLTAEDRLPYVLHVDGTRLYRRGQLEVVAQGRDAMWHLGQLSSDEPQQ